MSAVNMEEMPGALPDVKGREISEEDSPKAGKVKKTKPKVEPTPVGSVDEQETNSREAVNPDESKPAEVTAKHPSKHEVLDENGKSIKDMMEKDVVPALVRPTDRAADTMALQDRIAYEKKIRDEERRKNKLPIKVTGFPVIKEY